MLATVILLGCAVAQSLAADVERCDIVVAGGSTASLAAAITAAETDPGLEVCFTEITDWPGGQMTSGGVPAIDFGELNSMPENQPRSFREAMTFLGGPEFNPGACWVSKTCYLPNRLVEGFIMPRLAATKNLRVFLRTVVVDTERSAATGAISALTAVQRTPVDPSLEWTARLSEELPDWYSPANSTAFSKHTIRFEAPVFIEATELADVLVTGNFSWTQGAETPRENSTSSSDGRCGQAWTLTFYMELLAAPPAEPHVVPPGSAEGSPWPSWEPSGPKSWAFRTWNYRRSHCAGNRSLDAVNVGDVSQQNLGNDLETAYVPLPSSAVAAQRPWAGGLNLTAVRMLEDRAYGYFHYVRATAPEASMVPRLVLNRTVSGTRHGLSKFLYLRDTRRGFGLPPSPPPRSAGWPPPAPARPSEGFRVMYFDLSQVNASAPGRPSVRPADAVGLQTYNDDCHSLAASVCSLPPYMAEHVTRPFWLPARMLLQRGAPNLLLAGKTAAQTFHANGAVRLHPGEWTMGVAAGAAAVLFVRRGLTDTARLLDADAAGLRALLNSSAVGQPLLWTGGKSFPPQTGYQCAPFAGGTGVCAGTDAAHRNASRPLCPDASCRGLCGAMAADEWLANADFWSAPDAAGDIRATAATVLKKSFAQSAVLPPDELRGAAAGQPCRLASPEPLHGYWLCTIA